MEISESGIQNCVAICCGREGISEPPDKPCYWGTHFLTTLMMFTNIKCTEDTGMPKPYLQEFVSQCPVPEDADLENDLFNLFKFDPEFMNILIYERLVRRTGAGNFNCSLLHVIANETGDTMTMCSTLFGLSFPSLAEFGCIASVDDYENEVLYKRIMSGISLPFLGATLLIYMILPELRRNLHGLILRSYIACFFIYTIFEVIPHKEFEPPYNLIIEACMTYFGMGLLFWLNVMCFDIWCTFRVINERYNRTHETLHGSMKQQISQRITIYSMYAWGIPMLMVALYYCNLWAGRKWIANLSFVYGPGALTILFNIFFFVLTAVEINRQEKEAARHLDNFESRRHNDKKQRFNVYLKLFVVMGLSRVSKWIMIWFDLPQCKWIVYVVQGLQFPAMLQGIFIFITTVRNKNTKRLLSKRVEDTMSRIRTRSTSQ